MTQTEALAQPEQEPVAWRAPNWGHGDDEWVYRDFDDPVLIADGKPSPNNEALYTTPPQRKPLTSAVNDEMLAALEWITTYIENAPQQLTEAHQWAKISRGIIEAAHGIKE